MLTDAGLFDATGVRIAFTGRRGGVSGGCWSSLNCAAHVEDDEDAVARNRRIVLEAMGASRAQLVVPNQVHGTDAVVLGPGVSGVPEDGRKLARAVELLQSRADEGADAVVVGLANVAALLNFADCLPLIVVAPNGFFAVAHAGWRGAVGRIASKAVLQLSRLSGCEPGGFNAYIGPHIGGECFEVGPEVARAFSDEFGSDVLVGADHVSLAAAVSVDLESAGIDPARIEDAMVCTKCRRDEYFSYRAEGGRCGRNAAAAVRLNLPGC